MNLDTAAGGLAALGHPARLTVYRLLVRAGPEGLTVGDIQRHTELAASTLAHHLRALVGAGLVQQQKSGREVVCTADYARMNDLVQFLTEACCVGFGDTPSEGCP